LYVEEVEPVSQEQIVTKESKLTFPAIFSALFFFSPSRLDIGERVLTLLQKPVAANIFPTGNLIAEKSRFQGV
jgi:hypothetical protein